MRQFFLRPSVIFSAVFAYSVGMLLSAYFLTHISSYIPFITAGIFVLSICLIVQSLFSLHWMLYAWENMSHRKKNLINTQRGRPEYSFSAIVPVRNEEMVVGDTLAAISSINYPQELTEILVVVRQDDVLTIKAVHEAIEKLGNPSLRLLVFDGNPINKPHALNIALSEVSKEITVIFDAEDEPNHEIYNVVNNLLLKKDADVIQCGVQLVNFKSHWFSAFNVLEYFFWFKSALHFFAKNQVVPLGGNTVFFKTQMIKDIGGWDETALTEDADIGIRLSARGAKIAVVYSEELSTQEETPSTISSFIKQRTRWNQGFMQVVLKGEWRKLPTFKQRVLALYILLTPQIQAFMFILTPVSILATLALKLSVSIALLTTIPMLILILQFVTYNIGLYEFTRGYKLSYPIYMPLVLLLTFYPFQFLLGISACRAVKQMIFRNFAWEKTEHLNLHRAYEQTASIRT